MANFSIKVNLLKLTGAFLINFKGNTTTKRCVVIPIDDSNLFLGEKGLYLDLSALELNEPKYQESHCIKQSLPQEVFEKMSEEERKATPIIGGMRVMEKKQTAIAIDTTYDASAAVEDPTDLPF